MPHGQLNRFFPYDPFFRNEKKENWFTQKNHKVPSFSNNFFFTKKKIYIKKHFTSF